MSFQYNLNLPNGPDNPSNDQPGMQTNTKAVNDLLAVDHIEFNLSNGGFHKQVHMPVLNSRPIGIANEGTVYTKTAATTPSNNESTLFYNPDNTLNEYQLTRTITTQFSKFATNTNYITPITTNGGWTFLPGGMLLQWGNINPTHNPGTTTVNFPIAFTNVPYSIQITATVISSGSSNDQTAAIVSGSTTTTNFLASTSSSGNVIGFYWMAIGI
jgi:hypothetical protein